MMMDGGWWIWWMAVDGGWWMAEPFTRPKTVEVRAGVGVPGTYSTASCGDFCYIFIMSIILLSLTAYFA